MTWNFASGIGTSVHIDGHFDLTLNNPQVFSAKADENIHGLFGVEAVSQPPDGSSSRGGEIKLTIHRKCGPNVPPASKAIAALLCVEMEKLTEPQSHCILRYCPSVRPPLRESWTDTEFVVSYFLDNGEAFCDSTIEIARAVFVGLGIHDDRGYHLANFSLKRETFVKIDDVWIAFPCWLRMSHRLPIMGPEDHP